MTAVGNNSLNTRTTLTAAGKTYASTPSPKPPPSSATSPACPSSFEDGKTAIRAV